MPGLRSPSLAVPYLAFLAGKHEQLSVGEGSIFLVSRCGQGQIVHRGRDRRDPRKEKRRLMTPEDITPSDFRRDFYAIAQQQLKVANRAKGEVALLFADMDKFKSINDQWGHQKGDEALVSMADILKHTFRESDLIARISGDEFALLLIDTPEKNMSIVFNRLQKNIDAFNIHSGGMFNLSLSIGMSVYYHDRPCSVDELLRQADRRMYEQKQLKKTGKA